MAARSFLVPSAVGFWWVNATMLVSRESGEHVFHCRARSFFDADMVGDDHLKHAAKLLTPDGGPWMRGSPGSNWSGR
jgi:hypothetical protein